MEYLPFGEMLVEEHKNSNNSPFKFNGKELDEETGNYYYGARYYDPKFSIWLSVDPMAEKYPGWSPYNYTLDNPINLTDPTGMVVEGPGDGCPTCPNNNDYQGHNRNQVHVFFGNDNNHYTPNREKSNDGFFQSISNALYSFSDYIDKRMSMGSGLKLWYSGGNGEGETYKINAKTGVSVNVDEFVDNALMPEIGPSPSSKVVKGLELGATIIGPIGNHIGDAGNKNKKGNNLIPIQIPDTNARRFSNGIKFKVIDTTVMPQDYHKYQNKKRKNTHYLDSLLHLNNKK